MTRAKEDTPGFDPQQASQSLARIAERSQRLVAGFLNRRETNGIGMADPANVGKAFIDLTQRIVADPVSVTAATVALWNEHLKLWQHTTRRLIGGTRALDVQRSDRRFRDPGWSDNPIFEYVKQSYLLSADAILSAVRRVEGLDAKGAHNWRRHAVLRLVDSEVLQRTLRLGSPVLVRGYLDLAKRVHYTIR